MKWTLRGIREAGRLGFKKTTRKGDDVTSGFTTNER